MNNPVIMHVNYGEQRYDSYGSNTVADICKMAAELGFDGIEFRGTPPKEFKEMPFLDYAKQIEAGMKEYGLSHILMGMLVGECLSTDKDARQKSIDTVVEKTKIANDLLGTTVFNCFTSYIACPVKTKTAIGVEFNGSAAATEEQWKLTVDLYQQLAKKLEPLGVKYAFETHMNYIHDLPEATMKLVNLIDSPVIGVNMDFGNTMYFPEHPTVEEAIDLYGDKLFYTHLKNSSPVAGGRKASALSDGEINHRVYLKKLKAVGYAGPIGIEAPRPGDRYWFAQQDLAYYKTVAQSI